MAVVDLSHVVGDGTVTYPGLPAPVITEHLSREPSRATEELVRAEIAGVRAELADLRADVARTTTRLVMWMVGVSSAQLALIVALLRTG